MIMVNGKELPWEEDMTVETVLKRMNYTFPKIVVRVDGTVVKKEQWSSYRVPEGAEVQAHHLIAGG